MGKSHWLFKSSTEPQKGFRKRPSNPLSVLHKAVQGVTPDLTVKARRVGASTHGVPIEGGTLQGKSLAIRWLLEAS